MTERSLDRLHPRLQPIARKWVHIVRDDLGLDARVTETLRSFEAQLADAAAGSSSVTVGWHNCGWCAAQVKHVDHYGLAVDFACFDEHGVRITEGTHGDYHKAGLVWQALDAHSPIRLANGALDAGHAEYHPGFTWTEYIAFLRLGKDWLS